MRVGSSAVVLVGEVAARIAVSSASWGSLVVAIDEANSIMGATGLAEGDGPTVDLSRDTLRTHVLSGAPKHAAGYWYKAPPGLHGGYRWSERVGIDLHTKELAALIPAWRTPSKDGAMLVVTYDPATPEQEYAAWAVTSDWTTPEPITLLPLASEDPLLGVAGQWPLEELRRASITLVGVGSIGSACAYALAAAGVGNLVLVDPDRLLWHNLARHQSDVSNVGRYKVAGMADSLGKRWPGTQVTGLPASVTADADLMRPLFDDSDLIVCTADGVAARRVVSHLARRAGRPAVLGCVLHEGAIGEVLRLRPWSTHGCLLCQRAALIADGAMDPEPSIDRPYGAGDQHRPMTAFGPDLAIIGQLTAKVALATLLEAAGHDDQFVEGESMTIGLRADGSVRGAHAPFNVSTGQILWQPAVPPRLTCPTCQR